MSIDFLYAALVLAGVVLGLALLLAAARGARHLVWLIERRRDRRGRKGDLLEALARKIEGPLL